MADNKVDLNAPVTDDEIQKRLEGLSQEQLQQTRDNQILDEIRLRAKMAKPVNLGAMTNEEFRAYCRQFGF